MDNLGLCLAVGFFSRILLVASLIGKLGWFKVGSLSDPPASVSSSTEGVIRTKGNGRTVVKLCDRPLTDPVLGDG